MPGKRYRGRTMGQGAAAGLQWPGYDQWRATFGGSRDNYRTWLRDNGYSSAREFADSLSAGGSLGNQVGGPNLGNIPVPGGQIPVPGQPGGALPVPIAPPTSIPSPSSGSSFAPPPVQMPAMLPNPRPQGLGGMPLIRDRMMANTMAPFAGPNWGVPQVNPAYLTQQMRLPGGNTGAIPVTNMPPPAAVSGFGNNGTTPSGWAAGPQLGSALGQAAELYLQNAALQQQQPIPAPVGLGGMRIPRQPMIGMGTA